MRACSHVALLCKRRPGTHPAERAAAPCARDLCARRQDRILRHIAGRGDRILREKRPARALLPSGDRANAARHGHRETPAQLRLERGRLHDRGQHVPADAQQPPPDHPGKHGRQPPRAVPADRHPPLRRPGHLPPAPAAEPRSSSSSKPSPRPCSPTTAATPPASSIPCSPTSRTTAKSPPPPSSSTSTRTPSATASPKPRNSSPPSSAPPTSTSRSPTSCASTCCSR